MRQVIENKKPLRSKLIARAANAVIIRPPRLGNVIAVAPVAQPTRLGNVESGVINVVYY